MESWLSLAVTIKPLKLWNTEKKECVLTLRDHSSAVTSVFLSEDNRFALSGSWDNSLKLWDLNSGRCVRTMRGHEARVNSVHMDERFALSGGDDKKSKVVGYCN